MQVAYDLAAARKDEAKIKVYRQHVPSKIARVAEKPADPPGERGALPVSPRHFLVPGTGWRYSDIKEA